MSYASEVLADAPYGYWRLGEASGAVAADSSGNGHDLSYSSAHGPYTLGRTGLLTADSNTSVELVQATIGPNFLVNSGTVSIEAWVKIASYAPAIASLLVGFDDGLNGPSYDKDLGINSAGHFEWYVFDGAGEHLTDPSPLVTNQTYHLVGRVGPSGQSLWVNGVKVAENPGVTSSFTGYSVPNFMIGGSTPGYAYLNDFVVDEVALYITGLQDTRISAHYNAGIGAGATAPIFRSLDGSRFGSRRLL